MVDKMIRKMLVKVA